MKYTTPYPHQCHQHLARLLLTIWLFTMCSPEAICSPGGTLPASRSNSSTLGSDCVVVAPPTSSSADHKQEPSQASNVVVVSVVSAKKALEQLNEILSAGENQALLKSVQQTQQQLAQAFPDEQTTTSSPTNTPKSTTTTQEAYSDAAQNLQEIAQKLLLSMLNVYQPQLPSFEDFEKTGLSLEKLGNRYKKAGWKARIEGSILCAAFVVWLVVRVAWYAMDPLAVPTLLEIMVREITDKKKEIAPEYKAAIDATVEATDIESRNYHKNRAMNLGRQIDRLTWWGLMRGFGVFAWMSVVISAAFLGLGFYLSGYCELRRDLQAGYMELIKDQEKKMRQGAEACKQLNPNLPQHLEKALKVHRQGNVEECLSILSTKYDENQPPLLPREMNRDSLTELTEFLKKYGFRAPVIAWLLLVASTKLSKEEVPEIYYRVSPLKYDLQSWQRWLQDHPYAYQNFSHFTLSIQKELKTRLGYQYISYSTEEIQDAKEEGIQDARKLVEQDIASLEPLYKISRRIQELVTSRDSMKAATGAIEYYLTLNPSAKAVSAAPSAPGQ